MFLAPEKQFQNELDSSLKVFISVPIYSGTESRNKSKSRNRSIKKSLRSRSRKVNTLDRGFQGITDKFIVYRVYRKVHAKIATEVET